MVSVSEIFGIEKSTGFGIEKKFWIRFRSDFGFRHTLHIIRVATLMSSKSQYIDDLKVKTIKLNLCALLCLQHYL